MKYFHIFSHKTTLRRYFVTLFLCLSTYLLLLYYILKCLDIYLCMLLCRQIILNILFYSIPTHLHRPQWSCDPGRTGTPPGRTSPSPCGSCLAARSTRGSTAWTSWCRRPAACPTPARPGCGCSSDSFPVDGRRVGVSYIGHIRCI